MGEGQSGQEEVILWVSPWTRSSRKSKKTRFPLELRSASLLNSAAYSIKHNIYYIDISCVRIHNISNSHVGARNSLSDAASCHLGIGRTGGMEAETKSA